MFKCNRLEVLGHVHPRNLFQLLKNSLTSEQSKELHTIFEGYPCADSWLHPLLASDNSLIAIQIHNSHHHQKDHQKNECQAGTEVSHQFHQNPYKIVTPLETYLSQTQVYTRISYTH